MLFNLHIGPQCNSQGIGCQDSLLPADIDSPTDPPPGEDQLFIGSVADVSTSQLSLYSVHIDWNHISQAWITGDLSSPQLIKVPILYGPFAMVASEVIVSRKRASAISSTLSATA